MFTIYGQRFQKIFYFSFNSGAEILCLDRFLVNLSLNKKAFNVLHFYLVLHS